MLCQSCGTLNDTEREFCLRCGGKLLVLSGPRALETSDDLGDEIPIEEHFLERISILEEVVRRTAESLRALLDYLYRTERNAAVSEAGVRALAELLAARDVLPEDEIRELWDRKTDERAGALDVRERFSDRREGIVDRFAGGAKRKERFERLVGEADFHILAGDPERGLASLEDAIRLDRRNVDLHLFLGETYFNAGDLDRARPHLDSALTVEPDRFDALVYRGAIAAERGDAKRAVDVLERAIRVEPDSALPRFALGAFHVLRGEWLKARPHLEAALVREETPQVHFFLGQARMEAGDTVAATEHFRKVLRLDPAHEDAQYHLGLCYLDRNWTRRAQACFERALSLNPTRIEYQQAEHLLRGTGASVHALGKEAAALYREAEKRATAGSSGEAYSLIRRARSADPDDPVLAVTHALLSSSLGRTTEAISAAREALRRSPQEVLTTAAYVALCEALRAEGRHDEAVRAAQEMLAECDSQFARTIAHYEVAMALADSGEEARSEEALRAAAASLRAAPREIRGFPLEALGWVHYRRRDYGAAVSYLERAAGVFPSRSALTHLGTALLAAGERQRARDVLRSVGREKRGHLRIEDRIREQVRRQVRLDESVQHEKSETDEAFPVTARAAREGVARPARRPKAPRAKVARPKARQ